MLVSASGREVVCAAALILTVRCGVPERRSDCGVRSLERAGGMNDDDASFEPGIYANMQIPGGPVSVPFTHRGGQGVRDANFSPSHS